MTDRGLRARYGLVDAVVSEHEPKQAQKLIEAKSATPEWTERVP